MKNLTITVLMAACSCALAGEIHEIYFKKVRANPDEWIKSRMKSHAGASISSTNHGITQIGIEHTPSFGSSPVYTFIVKSDGSFQNKGEKYVERQ